MSDDHALLEALRAAPVGPPHVPPTKTRDGHTAALDLTDDKAVVELKRGPGQADETAATEYLREQGLDPTEWEQVGLRRSEWTMPNGDTGDSVRVTWRRIPAVATAERPPIDDLLAIVKAHEPVAALPEGEHGFLVLIGDMQFGKADGDGPEGTVRRTITALNKAADRLIVWGQLYDIGHVHVAWLGDHIEGFVSQGGANAWRTTLTLSEQIRITRRVMLHALTLFAPLASRVTMAAVPGNHGDTVRFAGKGVTRYDDSHDTESLVAVADAAALNPAAFSHVKFYTPGKDEMTVVLDVAGTTIAHVHGHQFRPGKHFAWWEGQSFGGSPLADADLLVAGHLHHEFVDTSGPRKFIQVPSLESESTWYRHAKGVTGSPGLIVAVTKDGRTDLHEVVRGE